MTAVDIYPAHAILDDVTLSAVEDGYIEWIIKEVTGWEASESTIDTQQKPRQNGGWAGDAFDRSKTIALAGRMYAGDAQSAVHAVDRLIQSNSKDPVKLTVTQWGITRWTMVRREDQPLIVWRSSTSCDWSLQMVALDPRRFGEPVSLSVGLPQTVDGLTIPFTIPFNIPSTRNTGELVNVGIIAGPVTLRITGPVVNPVITHTGSSGTQVFAMRISLDVGEWLDIDMDAHTVLAQGHEPRNGYITQRGWSTFDPGPNSFAFSADHYTGALLNITATPAY